MSTPVLIRKVSEIRSAVDALAWIVGRRPDDDDTRVAEAMMDALMWAIGEGAAEANMMPEVLAEIGQLQKEVRGQKRSCRRSQ